MELGIDRTGTNNLNTIKRPETNNPMAKRKVSVLLPYQLGCNYIVFRQYRNLSDSCLPRCWNTSRHPDWRSVRGWTYRRMAVRLATHLCPFSLPLQPPERSPLWFGLDFSHPANSSRVPSSTTRRPPVPPMSPKRSLFLLRNSMESRHLHRRLVGISRRMRTDT